MKRHRSPLRAAILSACPWLRGHENGQAMVEFAMLAPLLMLMLLGTIDFGRAMYALVTVNNAAFHSALWSSAHMRQGVTGCGGANSTTLCCPVANNTASYNANSSPTTIREVVLRDFLVGLTYTPSCPSANTTVSTPCNPSVSCATGLESSYTYGGGTQYRYVDIQVTYRWSAVGPYGVLLGSFDLPKTVRMRKIP